MHADMVDHWVFNRKLEDILKMKRQDEPTYPFITENLEDELAWVKNMVSVQNDVKRKNEDQMIEQIEDIQDQIVGTEHDIKMIQFKIKMKEKEMNIQKLKLNELKWS